MTVERCAECGFDGTAWKDADAVNGIAELPAQWSQAIDGLGDEALGHRPIAGTWSIAEYTDHWIARHAVHDVTHHLLDVERLRAALGSRSGPTASRTDHPAHAAIADLPLLGSSQWTSAIPNLAFCDEMLA